MIKARHDSVIYPFFQWYSSWIIRRNFHHVVIEGTIPKTDRPILLLANHVSWWDGFWALYLNTIVFQRRFHFMMLENQLRKYWYFTRCGGFSVQKRSRNILESLDYTSQLLLNPKNLVLIFPQGEICSQQQWNIHFEKGVEHIMKHKIQNAVQVVFLISLTDYFTHKKPVLTFFLHEYTNSGTSTVELRAAFSDFYKNCQNHQSKIAE